MNRIEPSSYSPDLQENISPRKSKTPLSPRSWSLLDNPIINWFSNIGNISPKKISETPTSSRRRTITPTTSSAPNISSSFPSLPKSAPISIPKHDESLAQTLAEATEAFNSAEAILAKLESEGTIDSDQLALGSECLVELKFLDKKLVQPILKDMIAKLESVLQQTSKRRSDMQSASKLRLEIVEYCDNPGRTLQEGVDLLSKTKSFSQLMIDSHQFNGLATWALALEVFLDTKSKK